MNYPFKLIGLTYEYDSLNPVISKTTMEFHRDKHLATYLKNLNTLLAHQEDWHSSSLEEILINVGKLPEELRIPVINNGGGVYNHLFYFQSLCRPHTSMPSSRLTKLFDRDFGSFEHFKAEFTDKALTQFGSGWAWLVADKKGKLSVIQLGNQATPLPQGLTPLLNIDVWEHAYYLDYQNMRADYIRAFYDIIDWSVVEARLDNIPKK